MPSELREFVETRAMVNGPYALGLEGETLICVPNSTLDIIRVFLFEYGQRRVNFYRQLTDVGYFTLTDEEFGQIDALIGDFLWRSSTVGLCEDILTAVNNISIAILNQGGCGCQGSGGAGTVENEPSTFEDVGDNFPDGYEDRAEYDTNKCNLARYILDTLADDMGRMKQIDAAGKSAALLATLLGLSFLLPVPFVNLFVIAGIILGLLAISIDAVGTAASELQDFFEAMDICLLYSSDSAEQAKQHILDAIDAESFTYDALTKQLAQNLINFNSLNLLFDAKPPLINLPVGDCSGCAAAACLSDKDIVFGTGPSGLIIEGDYTSVFVAGPNCHYINVTTLGDKPIRFVSITGWGSCNPPDQFRIASTGDGSAGDLYTDDVFPTGQCFDPGFGGDLAFVFSGTGPFTITLECC